MFLPPSRPVCPQAALAVTGLSAASSGGSTASRAGVGRRLPNEELTLDAILGRLFAYREDPKFLRLKAAVERVSGLPHPPERQDSRLFLLD